MSEANRDAKIRAQHDLEAIARLRDNKDFRDYYQRRQGEKLAAAREKVLHDTGLDAGALFAERLTYLALREAAQLIDTDETGARNIIGPAAQED